MDKQNDSHTWQAEETVNDLSDELLDSQVDNVDYADALFRQGVDFERGRNVKADLPAAYSCFKAAAEQGHSKAQLNAALYLEEGKGTQKNIEAAFPLYKAAALQSSAEAQYHLALCYENGVGCSKNIKEAFRWFMASASQGFAPSYDAIKTAAKKGEPDALYCLGLCSYNGIGSEKDLESAFSWYKAAAVQGHQKAFQAIMTAAIKGETEAYKPLESLIKLGFTQAFDALKMWAQKGEPQAFAVLENLVRQDYPGSSKVILSLAERGHSEAFAVSVDLALSGNQEALETMRLLAAKSNITAFETLESLANNNNSGAMEALQSLAKLGNARAFNLLRTFVEKGNPLAFSAIEKMAMVGFAEAEYTLGVCYVKGHGTSIDLPKAFHIFKTQAENGSSRAFQAVGYIAQLGFIGAIEWIKARATSGQGEAFEMLHILADKGQADCCFVLSNCYYNGTGVRCDVKKAIYWCELSAQKGFLEAQLNLAEYYFRRSLNDNDPDSDMEDDDNLPIKDSNEYREEAFKWFSAAADNGSSKAFAGVMKLAEAGHPKAELKAAFCYLEGLSAEQNADKALYWYKKALEHDETRDEAVKGLQKLSEFGNSKAEMELGKTFFFSNAKDEEIEKVFTSFKEASEKGDNPEASYYLGLCYLEGRGTKKNLNEAYISFKKASKFNYPAALHQIGLCYLEGLGTEKNPKLAFESFGKAVFSSNQDIVPCDNANDDIDKYQAQNEHNDLVNKEALCNLGLCYLRGIGTDKNEKEAFELLTQSSEKDSPQGQYNLALLYKNGIGTKKDLNTAFNLFESSAMAKYPEAFYQLGICYKNGEGTLPNEGKAINAFNEAAFMGVAGSLLYLKAYAHKGNIQAQNALGRCFTSVLNPEKDLKKALYWYGKSALKDDSEAIRAISALVSEDLEGHSLLVLYNSAMKNNQKAARALITLAQGGSEHAIYYVSLLAKVQPNPYLKTILPFAEQLNPSILPALCFLALKKNNSDAFNAVKKYAQMGDHQAQYALGCCLLKGKGTVKNPKEAALWFKEASVEWRYSRKLRVTLFAFPIVAALLVTIWLLIR